MSLPELLETLKRLARGKGLALTCNSSVQSEVYSAVTISLDKAIEQNDTELAACAAAIVAECAKVAKGRETPGVKLMLPLLVMGLKQFAAKPHTVIQLLRALANICVDNVHNVREVRQSGVLEDVIGLISHSNTDVARNASGLTINAMLQDETFIDDAIKFNIVQRVIAILESETSKTQPLTRQLLIKLLSVVCDYEQAIANLVECGGLETVLNLLRTSIHDGLFEDTDTIICILETLESAVHQTPSTHRLIYEYQGIPLLLDIMEQYANQASNVSEGESIVQADDIKEKENETDNTTTDLVAIGDLLERVLVTATQEDTVTKELINMHTILDKLTLWLDMPDSHNKPSSTITQLSVCAALMLGNIGRSDESAFKLVHQIRVSSPLLLLLKKTPTSEAKLTLAIVLTLKNLSIPAGNKALLGELGVIEVVAPLIHHIAPDIQRTVVGLTKQLATDSERNVTYIVSEIVPSTSETTLQSLMRRYDKTDEIVIKVEIGRLVALVLKQLLAKADQPAKGIAMVNTIIIVTRLDPLWLLVVSSFPALRNEAIVALVMIMASSAQLSGDANAAIKTSLKQLDTTMTAFNEILLDSTEQKYPVQVKMNTARLLLVIAQLYSETAKQIKEQVSHIADKGLPQKDDLHKVYEEVLKRIAEL